MFKFLGLQQGAVKEKARDRKNSSLSSSSGYPTSSNAEEEDSDEKDPQLYELLDKPTVVGSAGDAQAWPGSNEDDIEEVLLPGEGDQVRGVHDARSEEETSAVRSIAKIPIADEYIGGSETFRSRRSTPSVQSSGHRNFGGGDKSARSGSGSKVSLPGTMGGDASRQDFAPMLRKGSSAQAWPEFLPAPSACPSQSSERDSRPPGVGSGENSESHLKKKDLMPPDIRSSDDLTPGGVIEGHQDAGSEEEGNDGREDLVQGKNVICVPCMRCFACL